VKYSSDKLNEAEFRWQKLRLLMLFVEWI